jgi:hypothetical protein
MGKKVIRLTEADLEKLINKVLSEQGWEERGKPEELKLTFDLKEVFPSGEYRLRNTSELDAVVSKIKSVVEEYGKNTQFNLILTGGESLVTNPKGFEEQGSLARQRIEVVFEYLKSKLGNIIKDVKENIVIGRTPYEKGKDNPDDEKYTREQFIKIEALSDAEVIKKVFVASKPKHGVSKSDNIYFYGFLDGSSYTINVNQPEQQKYVPMFNKTNGTQDWRLNRSRLYRVCNRYDSLCKEVEYPREKRKVVDNDKTFREMVQKMQNEKLRFPISPSGQVVTEV